jgi:hypothetical protein
VNTKHILEEVTQIIIDEVQPIMTFAGLWKGYGYNFESNIKCYDGCFHLVPKMLHDLANKIAEKYPEKVENIDSIIDLCRTGK